MSKVLSFAEKNYEQFIRELTDLIAIPSISNREESRPDMKRAAEWLSEHLTGVGLRSEVIATAGHPVVYAEWLGAPGKPTILLYGHYDVQPPEPLELWDSPPFELSERDGALFARGISDDKGQLFIHVKAMEGYLQEEGALPVNVKLIFEGEEEIGSPSLPAFLEKHQDKLAADIAVISDNPMLGRNMPAVGYGLRGLSYLEIKLTGPASDLHSGRFGGAVANPANVLCTILASLKDEKGAIAIPGIYDDVIPLTPEEREQIRNLPLNDEGVRKAAGSPQLAPEEGFSAIEAIWARPSLDINGIGSGFQGEGAKTVIPSVAMAKISSRLVPNQDPEKISALIEEHLKKISPPGVEIEVKRLEGASPAMVDRNDPLLTTAKEALEKGFELPCSLIRQGGTIPVVSLFKKILDQNTLLLGFGLPEENAHAPNEFLLADNFKGGLRSIIHLYKMLGKNQ